MTHAVTLVRGDTTGPDIIAATQALIAAAGADIAWDEPGPYFSEQVPSIRKTKVALMGYTRGDRSAGQLPPIVQFRQEFHCFANVRPLKDLPSLPGRFQGVDAVVVRETTEDVYAHMEHESLEGIYESFKVTTAGACERIARFAFDYARRYGRKKVTIVHKSNIMKLSDGMFLRIARKVAEEYPEIAHEDVIVDALCMKLVLTPERYDVIVCGNLFGDIVADLGCGLVGGPANCPSINVGPEAAIFTAGHGAPAAVIGTDDENPLKIMLPAVHLLHHLGEVAPAQRLQGAIAQVLAAGTVPRRLGGKAGAADFCKALRLAVG